MVVVVAAACRASLVLPRRVGGSSFSIFYRHNCLPYILGQYGVYVNFIVGIFFFVFFFHGGSKIMWNIYHVYSNALVILIFLASSLTPRPCWCSLVLKLHYLAVAVCSLDTDAMKERWNFGRILVQRFFFL